MVALNSVCERLFLKLSGMSVNLDDMTSAMSFLAIVNARPKASANTIMDLALFEIYNIVNRKYANYRLFVKCIHNS